MQNNILVPEQIVGSIYLLPEGGGPRMAHLPPELLIDLWVACDFFLSDFPLTSPMPWGYESGHSHLVDHHAPDARWERHISSGNLAVDWVKSNAPPATVFINHTDCDSILSSGIVAGILEPKPEYEAAVIAADHTGEVNPIADLLQAIQDFRDVHFSLECLRRLEQGEALPEQANHELEMRTRQRAKAIEITQNPSFVHPRFTVFEVPEVIEAELLCPMVARGDFLMLSVPMEEFPGRRALRLRRTATASDGFSLHHLDLRSAIPGYGGRWNAGSNKRNGGTDKPMAQIIEDLTTLLDAN